MEGFDIAIWIFNNIVGWWLGFALWGAAATLIFSYPSIRIARGAGITLIIAGCASALVGHWHISNKNAAEKARQEERAKYKALKEKEAQPLVRAKKAADAVASTAYKATKTAGKGLEQAHKEIEKMGAAAKSLVTVVITLGALWMTLLIFKGGGVTGAGYSLILSSFAGAIALGAGLGPYGAAAASTVAYSGCALWHKVRWSTVALVVFGTIAIAAGIYLFMMPATSWTALAIAADAMKFGTALSIMKAKIAGDIVTIAGYTVAKATVVKTLGAVCAISGAIAASIVFRRTSVEVMKALKKYYEKEGWVQAIKRKLLN